MRRKRQRFFLGKRKYQLLRQCTFDFKALAFQSLPASPQGHLHTMVTKQHSQNPKPFFTNQQINSLLKICAFAGIIAIAIVIAVFFSVFMAMYKMRAEVGEQFKVPLQRLTKVEQDTSNVGELAKTQNDMRIKLAELDIKFDLYFGEKRLDQKTSENIVDRAVERVTTTGDPIEQNVALQVTTKSVNKATSSNVVMDYKKVNRYGLALLNHSYKDDQKPLVKDAISGLARQRVLKLPEPKIPDDKEQEIKYIRGGDQRLDATPFENVVFVNCNIIYGQGWIGLTNVRFINCTFDVSPVDKGKELYDDLFSSDDPIPFVSVRTPSPDPNTLIDKPEKETGSSDPAKPRS